MQAGHGWMQRSRSRLRFSTALEKSSKPQTQHSLETRVVLWQSMWVQLSLLVMSKYWPWQMRLTWFKKHRDVCTMLPSIISSQLDLSKLPPLLPKPVSLIPWHWFPLASLFLEIQEFTAHSAKWVGPVFWEPKFTVTYRTPQISWQHMFSFHVVLKSASSFF